MVKEMKYRDIRKAMLAQGCTMRPGKGDHENWYCPCGKHMATVTKTREVSPGVVRDTIDKMRCLPKGWLQ